MPFIGQDWRSPGEKWVKTDEGWERKKLVEYLARGSRDRLDLVGFDDSDSPSSFDSSTSGSPPDRKAFYPITLKCTKEIAGFNGLSEALKRLDFLSGVKDIRRFNYICKLLHLLITENLTTLSGCTQKVLFTMLEEVAFQVSTNKTNMHILQKLLSDLKKTLFEYYCWGRPQGSTALWEHHLQTIDRINNMADCIVIEPPAEDLCPKFEDLPEECVREILLRLDDHRDLCSSGEACGVMCRVLDEQRIWRELCRFHFTKQQISHVLSPEVELIDWQQMYHKLRKTHGLREEYAEILQLCRHCRCLFWKSYGHPCVLDETQPDPNGNETTESLEEDTNVAGLPGSVSQSNNAKSCDRADLFVPIPPQAFLKFFSL